MTACSKLSLDELRQRLKTGQLTGDRATLRQLRKDRRRGARKLYLRLKRKIESEETEKRRISRLMLYENELWESGITRIAGVDEVGVGPLAGPVVSAAVLFPPAPGRFPVNDSKLLSQDRREFLEGEILDAALAVGIGIAMADEIDRINVYQAALASMRRACKNLNLRPEHVLVDARIIPRLDYPQTPIIQGDRLCFSIAAASILAKTYRDRLMRDYDRKYPGYGFARHKGYPTRQHRDAIRRLGPCPIHRRSFRLLPEDPHNSRRLPSLFPSE